MIFVENPKSFGTGRQQRKSNRIRKSPSNGHCTNLLWYLGAGPTTPEDGIPADNTTTTAETATREWETIYAYRSSSRDRLERIIFEAQTK